ncbi:PepSY domain-containing protein [Pigmentiphaga soli]|uniref:PepSY domain-containing protein n=1 Tax=Pigmentiphaga soli TaxID=1007095 RepID=UPI0031EA5611
MCLPLRRRALPALAAAALCLLPPALAAARDQGCGKDQDCARRALVSGQIKPLSDVLQAVRDKVPGDVIEIELDHDDGRWIYEVKVLPPNGRRKKLKIDANTLDILKMKTD